MAKTKSAAVKTVTSVATTIPSSDVKVFPASNRGNNIDKYAKLNIEHNLINIVNRLTGIDSFIVSGLNVDATGKQLSSGVCNIHGYLFEFADGVLLPSSGSYSRGDLAYLVIRVREHSIADDTNGMEQLCNAADSTSNASDASGVFNGVGFVTGGSDLSILSPFYGLAVAQWDGSKWVTYCWEDNSGNNNRAFEQLFSLNQIAVNNFNSNSASFADKTQDLKTFLELNYYIDDGEIN